MNPGPLLATSGIAGSGPLLAHWRVPPARVRLIRLQLTWAIHPCHRVGLFRLLPAAPVLCGDRKSPFANSAWALALGLQFAATRFARYGTCLSVGVNPPRQKPLQYCRSCSLPPFPSRVGRLRLSPGRARVSRRSEKSFRLSGPGLRLGAVWSRRLASPGMGDGLRRGDPPAGVSPYWAAFNYRVNLSKAVVKRFLAQF
jgi:hypothetical protein